MTEIDFYNEFEKQGLYMSRMISGSKTAYSISNPENLVVFNANIFVEGYGKVWFGDLDLTLDKDKLIQIGVKTQTILYVLSEHDGRFDKEKNPNFKKDAVWNTVTGLKEQYKEWFDNNTLLHL